MSFTLTGVELPVRLRPLQPMSDDDLLRFCSDNGDLTIEREPDGDLVILTPSNLHTSHKNLRIGLLLDEWAEKDGRGLAFDSNGGFTLPDTAMRAPDAAWLSNERWNALPPGEQDRFSRVVPEFIIELRSPSDSLPGLQLKMQSWIGNGVQLAWLIDPFKKAVTIYRPDREPEYLDSIWQVAGEGPVAGFVLPLDRIFA